MKETIARVSEILWNDWDPIGVNDEPLARSEYDGCALHLAGMLINGRPEQEMVEFLDSFVEEIGMPRDHEKSVKIASTITKLRALSK